MARAMTIPPRLPAMGSVRVDQEGGGPVMVLHGEIDTSVVADFDPAGDGSTQVVAVDASAVTFFGSAGVTLLLRCPKAMRETGGRPLLRRGVRAPPPAPPETGPPRAFVAGRSAAPQRGVRFPPPW